MNTSQIAGAFNSLFSESFNTRLCGGFSEPFYKPASIAEDHHEIRYREDFASSALHELAHWCLAGSRRRRRNDFGYWYIQERGEIQQRQFEQVEAKPQGLEWILSVAAGVEFCVSRDNFNVDSPDVSFFRQLVRMQAQEQLHARFQPRTEQLLHTFARISGVVDFKNLDHYKGLPP